MSEQQLRLITSADIPKPAYVLDKSDMWTPPNQMDASAHEFESGVEEMAVVRVGETATHGLIEQMGQEARAYGKDELNERIEQYAQDLQAEKFTEDANTRELFSHFPPKSGIDIDGQEFMLSKIVKGSSREHCVGYVKLESGQVAPRLFYKSNSDGDWRVAPYYESWTDGAGKRRGYYSKGDAVDFGYVRETRLNDNLRTLLDMKAGLETAFTAENPPEQGNQEVEWILGRFSQTALGNTNTYTDEVDATPLGYKSKEKGVFDFEPGGGFVAPDGVPAREKFARTDVADVLAPNFDMPIVGLRVSEHPVLGEITTEAVASNGGNLVWNFSRDKQGRVWVSGVVNAGKKRPNSYGTDEEIVSAGIFDNKPIEYKSQIDGLQEGVDFAETDHPSYVDITPLLDNLKIIKDYRRYAGVDRLVA